MYCVKEIGERLYWVGGSDRRLARFENAFPVPRGVSYNAYVLLDEKTVLFDTVDSSIRTRFFENLTHVLAGRPLNYLIVNHMEPDHCAAMGELVLRYPDVKIVGNAKTMGMIKQFFDFDIDARSVIVAEGDTLCTGSHTLSFYMAPMVHWPEAMVTFDAANGALFSADAFGTFGALDGNVFADEVDFAHKWLPDARRYYTNIVGKYGSPVQGLLKKASGLEIAMLCPLHGPIWRKDIGWYVDKYQKWSTYTPEETAVMIVYASIYGDTENAAELLAAKLSDAGVRDIAMYDVSSTHPSDLVAESFRCSHLVFASVTYNGGIFPAMETLLLDLKAHMLQNRTVAIMQNGSWAPTCGRQMKALLSELKNMTILEPEVCVHSAVKAQQREEIEALAAAIVDSMK